MPEFSHERELNHFRTFIVRAVYIDGSEADLWAVPYQTRAEGMALLDRAYVEWREPNEFDQEWSMPCKWHPAVVALELFDAAEHGVIARYDVAVAVE
jgi:hypothetical protein